MELWQQLLKDTITDPATLCRFFSCDSDSIRRVCRTYPMGINPYALSLIKQPGDPVWQQVVPSTPEIDPSFSGMTDPLDEENLSPVPNLVHKYPDRVLFLVSSRCASYCRFCTRKRKVGTNRFSVTQETIRQGIEYIRAHDTIYDVLLSGGDPLMLTDEMLAAVLEKVRAIKHVGIIRIGSRVPSFLPQRITPGLVSLLKKFHPLYVNTHFNHPQELTPEAATACGRLADAGIPLGCQTVLLKGVNDSAGTLTTLFRELVTLRVRPYYLFQMDAVKGAGHFQTSVASGIAIMKKLIGHLSGMCVPTFALDAPGGGGKIPLTPAYVTTMQPEVVFTNFQGKQYRYPAQPRAHHD